MPVRKIPKNHLHVTGRFASKKNGQMGGFESLLEKEYMLLLDFDDTVDGFEEQPVTIPVPGVLKGYTPDLLVHFCADPATGTARRPLLVEVKHMSDLAKNAEKYTPKFAAAALYVLERGWEFGIMTEKEIRTPRLANIKFLREYRNIDTSEVDRGQIGQAMKAADGTASLQALLTALGATDEGKLYWLPIIWNMVLMNELGIGLDVPISNSVVIKLPEDRQ